jgi:hypothetical protein
MKPTQSGLCFINKHIDSFDLPRDAFGIREDVMKRALLSLFFLSFVLVASNALAEDMVLKQALQPDSYAGELKLDPKGENKSGYYTFFDWARGYNGWGYCYEFDRYGYVLHGGRPVHPIHCERVNPSYYDWARGIDGYFYCFQFTPYHAVMNEGRSVHPRFCR